MIYLLEDETSIRNLVIYTLEHSGFSAKGFAESESFFQAVEEQMPELVLLDIMLPGEDGLQVLEKLRAAAQTEHLPVIMLTAKDTEYDKVLGLDMGADDYLAKPFGMMELVARIKSLLRRTERDDAVTGEYRIGALFVSLPRHCVTVKGRAVNLTLKEFDVLVYLLKNQGIVLTRDQIMSAVWGYDFDGESRTVDVHIRSLRVKLGECERLVETVRGVGYRIGGEK